jgi:hypothetical protein
MPRSAAIAVALLLMMGQATAYDLQQHLWRHRLLFLVAPAGDDPQLIAQGSSVQARRDAILDRDLRVFALSATGGSVDGRALPADSVRDLRDQLDVGDAERLLILVGKDGGVKRRAPLDSSLREIFLQIDQMPMRRDEMRAKEAAGMTVSEP